MLIMDLLSTSNTIDLLSVIITVTVYLMDVIYVNLNYLWIFKLSMWNCISFAGRFYSYYLYYFLFTLTKRIDQKISEKAIITCSYYTGYNYEYMCIVYSIKTIGYKYLLDRVFEYY